MTASIPIAVSTHSRGGTPSIPVMQLMHYSTLGGGGGRTAHSLCAPGRGSSPARGQSRAPRRGAPPGAQTALARLPVLRALSRCAGAPNPSWRQASQPCAERKSLKRHSACGHSPMTARGGLTSKQVLIIRIIFFFQNSLPFLKGFYFIPIESQLGCIFCQQCHCF